MTQHCALVSFIVSETKSLVHAKTRKRIKERIQDPTTSTRLMSSKEMNKNS